MSPNQVHHKAELKTEIVNLYYNTLLWEHDEKKFSTLFTEDFQHTSNRLNEIESKGTMLKRLAKNHFNTLKSAEIEDIMQEEPIKLNDDGNIFAHYDYTAEHDFLGKKIHAKLEQNDIFSFEISDGAIKIKKVNSKINCTPIDYTQEELQELRHKLSM
ncbi:MAG: hypothetical protein AAGG81_02330 [Chlamydiota bacterium]